MSLLLRTLYTWGWVLGLPVVFARLVWRSRQEPGYRQHLGERLARYPAALTTQTSDERLIWIHAVSVGETQAAEPLVRALLARDPGTTILLTHMTPAGRRMGLTRFADLLEAGRLKQAWLPYDLPWLVARFIRRFRPALGIVLETEVWPNLIWGCARLQVPLVLTNARLSERSYQRTARFGVLGREVYAGFAAVLAQTESDAARYRQLGSTRLVVTGNLKFDIVVPQRAIDAGQALRQRLNQPDGPRAVVCAASTRDGEERLLLDVWAKLVADLAARPGAGPRPLLLIIPRHQRRFDAVADDVVTHGFTLLRRSQLPAVMAPDAPFEQGSVPTGVDVMLGDSMGEMPMYYAASDFAFIGGSLLPLGGQNLIEPCAVGKPVLLGPHTFNFAKASDDAVAEGAALRVADAQGWSEAVMRLVSDDRLREDMGRAALTYAQRHQGATQRTVEALDLLLPAQ